MRKWVSCCSILTLAALEGAENFSARLEAAHRLGPAAGKRAYQALIPQIRAAGDMPSLVRAYWELAQLHKGSGEIEIAIAALHDMEVAAHLAARPADEAKAANLAGALWLSRQDLDAAASSLARAADLFAAASDDENAAASETRLAQVYLEDGQFPDALRYCQRSRVRAEKQAGKPWAADALRRERLVEAAVYKTSGREERALDLLRNAASAGPETQLQIGDLYRRLGDPVKGAEILERAAAQLDGRRGDLKIALLLELGALQARDLSRFTSAYDTFGAAREEADWAGRSRESLYARLARGESKYLDGFDDEAEVEWRDALWVARQAGSTEAVWRAVHGLGRVAERRAEVPGALKLFQQAVEALESPRARIEPGLGGPDLLPKPREAYDSMIGLLLASTDDNVDGRVLDLMERSRATAAAQWLMAERRPEMTALRSRIRLASARRLNAHAPAAKTLDAELAKLAADCLTLEPELKAQSAAVTIEKVQSRLASDTALVSYWMGASQAGYVWITARASGRVVHAFGDDERGKLHQYTFEVSHAGSGNIEPLGRELGELLLAFPFGSEIRKLYIIPDGPLTQAPFELLSSGSKPLLETHEISYLPSAAALVEPAAPRRTLFPWDTQLMVMAGPAGFVSPGAFTLLPQDEHWSKSSRTVSGIGRITPFLVGRVETLLGGQARAEAWNDPRRIPVLHLAMHGASDSQEPVRSRLLTASSDPQRRMEYLYLPDLRKFDLPHLDLATLPLVENDGARNFGDAMVAAGARAAVTPLWTQAEGAAGELLGQFYYFLGQGLTKAGALRAAKLELWRSKTALSHPAHWSGFVLTGRGFEPLPRAWSWTLLLAAGAGVVLAAGLALSLLAASSAGSGVRGFRHDRPREVE